MHREFPDILLATVSKSFAGFVPEEGSQIWQKLAYIPPIIERMFSAR